jgi:hypothetical protein
LEADIPAYGADTLFSKPPQSGKAEKRSFTASIMTGQCVSKAELCQVPLSGGSNYPSSFISLPETGRSPSSANDTFLPVGILGSGRSNMSIETGDVYTGQSAT